MQLLESIPSLSSSNSLSGLPKSIALIRKDLLPIHLTDVRSSLEYFKIHSALIKLFSQNFRLKFRKMTEAGEAILTARLKIHFQTKFWSNTFHVFKISYLALI